MTRPRETGFTLVELLVALALVGLLTVAIFGGLRLAERAWARADDRATDSTELWSAATVLRRAIADAYPASASPDPSDPMILFDGGPASLALIAPLPQAIAAGVMAELRFRLIADRGGRTLVMGWRLDLPSATTGGQLPESLARLLGHVRAIRFAYFGPSAAGGAPLWQRHWTGRERLPALVRVGIEREGLFSPDWPQLLVAPKAEMNLACRLDPLTLRCGRLP